MAGQVRRIRKPSELYQSILKTGRFILAILGADVGDENYRVSVVTFFVIGCILTYWVFSIMTIIRLFRVRWVIVLEASCMSFTVIQATTKLFGSIRKHRCFAKACASLKAIFTEFESSGAASYAALHRSMLNASKIMKLLMVWYIVCLLGMLITPFFMLLYNGQRHLMMPFLVPFLDPETDMGYWLTLVAHLIFLFVGALGLCIGDFLCIFPLSHMILFVEIFKMKREDLNATIEANCKSGRVDSKLLDLINWHRSYIDYFKNVKEFLSVMITVQIPTAGLTIAISIFIILASDWPGAYSFLLCAFFNLYSYCYLGTTVDKWNDKLCDEIYDIHWYRLKAYQQKTIRLMLMNAQKQERLKIAGCLPMSVATGLQVTKLVYSFTMFMIQFVVK